MWYMGAGSWASLALLLALAAKPMCMGASIIAALYWRIAEESLKNQTEKKEGE